MAMEYRIYRYFWSRKNYKQKFVLGNTVVKLVSHGDKCEEINFSVQGGTIYEVVIESDDSLDVVRQILDLLCCSYTLVYGYNEHDSDELVDNIVPETEKDDFWWGGIPQFCVSDTDCWYYALLLAEKAYGNQRMINAITRYNSAHKIVNLHPMDLEPRNDPRIREYLLSEQMNFANCIMACYAALEEVELDVEGSRKCPILNVDKTAWNPEIYAKVIGILKESGIDPNAELMWLSRMPNSPTQIKPLVKNIRDCEWSCGDIRDYYTTPVDALLRIKQLRNKAGAHNDKEGISLLSIYDVENAFHLTRTLLLIKFGIYKLIEED